MSRTDRSRLSKRQEALLADLFMEQFPDPYQNPRMDKARSLYKLAREAKGGVIVELGTYHGCGAISLAWGTAAGGKLPVITIDDYTPKRGWIGEPYGPQDRVKFWNNVHLAGMGKKIELLEMDVDAALEYWIEDIQPAPVALLFWDIGGKRLFEDFLKWSSLIVQGGVFAIHDTADCKFGLDQVRLKAQAAGEWKYEGMLPGYVYVLRRQ